MASMSPERELLMSTARWHIDSAAAEGIRDLIRAGVNWPELLANAIQHGLSPVLYEAITATSPDLISPTQGELLREVAHASVSWAMSLVRELLRLSELFSTAQIPAIPYKGPMLAGLAYGSFIRRDYADLDFAVSQNIFRRLLSCSNPRDISRYLILRKRT